MNLSPKVIIQYLLPHHILSWLCGKLASCRIKWLKNFFIIVFIKKYKISLEEYKETNPHNFSCFNDFFTRELREGVRSLPLQNNIVVSPCDGVISQIGNIADNFLIQAKGFNYSVSSLVGNKKLAENFINGSFATIYLAPSNYHRVHMPVSGKLLSMFYIQGKLFSVNKKTAETIPDLFSNNERVVAIFETVVGKMAVVFVGAMIVGSIETTWAGTINPHHKKEMQCVDYKDKEIVFNCGDEIGRFKLGSTVIVLFPANKIEWNSALAIQTPVKMGMALGYDLTLCKM